MFHNRGSGPLRSIREVIDDCDTTSHGTHHRQCDGEAFRHPPQALDALRVEILYGIRECLGSMLDGGSPLLDHSSFMSFEPAKRCGVFLHRDRECTQVSTLRFYGDLYRIGFLARHSA